MVKTDITETNYILDRNINLSEQKKNSFLGGERLLTAGIFYSEKGEYEMAVNYLAKAFLLFHRYDGPEWTTAIGRTQIVFGSVYYQQGDFAAALGYYLPAEEITTANNDYTSLRNVLSKIEDCYLNLNQVDAADIYAKKGLKISEKLATISL